VKHERLRKRWGADPEPFEITVHTYELTGREVLPKLAEFASAYGLSST
jgi:hypothetical protein